MLERLTASDLFLLLWDDYGWSTDIGALAILDGASLLDGDGRVRIESIRRQLEPRLHLVPRFRQLLYRPRPGLGWPLWVDAPAFDIADHMRVHDVDAPGGEAQLLEACQELGRRRLDPTRPLWELWLLSGLPDQRLGALLRLHHAVADGGAAAATFGALLDLAADAPTPSAPPWTPAPIPASDELLRDNLARRRQELRRGWSGITHPRRTLRRTSEALPAWREVLTEEPAPRTSLNRPVGSERRLAIVRGRLDAAKRIAHAREAKVNDVVLAAVAGGLRELLARRGEDVEGLVQRAMVTISLHEDEALGNKPGWMMVPLPLGEADAVRRLDLIAAETAARKHKARPEAGTGIFRFVAGQRVWYRRFPKQRSVNLVVTNIPGPPVPLYLTGAPLLELFPMLPPMGNLTLVVAVLSYAGQLNFTAVADRDACPDVDVFAAGVQSALEELAASAPRQRRRRRHDLYYEEDGEGVPILLIHPSGSTASTWGAAADELARIGRVITYDRRGYARSGGEPVRSTATHTADAAALLEYLRAPGAVVVGTSAGAAIAVDLAVRRPELVRAVVAHEFPWRFARRLPAGSQVVSLAKIGALALLGRHGDAAEVLLRSAYTYDDGRTAWDDFPEEWRRVARQNATPALRDFLNSIGTYPSAGDLATVGVPVVCSYGSRSPESMFRLVRALAAAIPTARTHRIEGAGHAAPFDATTAFVQLIADTIAESGQPFQRTRTGSSLPGRGNESASASTASRSARDNRRHGSIARSV